MTQRCALNIGKRTDRLVECYEILLVRGKITQEDIVRCR